MGKPLIGVLPLYDEHKKSYWMLPGYMKAVEEAGGVPVMLPLTTEPECVQILADKFDGFLFTGGHDVNPELYGEDKLDICGPGCDERDKMEAALFHKVLELDKPIFGICRGLQLINVVLGGTLYQDIPTQQQAAPPVSHSQSPPYAIPVHPVHIEGDTLLAQLLQTKTLNVNSYHHQGIKDLAGQLVAAARAEDGLVEAVVMPGARFILAVQWHPEFSYESDPYSKKLFHEFVKVCK